MLLSVIKAERKYAALNEEVRKRSKSKPVLARLSYLFYQFP
jgi:hypothetical protein